MSFDSIAQARKIEILTFALTLCRYVRSTSTNSPEKIQYGIFESCTGLIRDWSKYNSTLSQSTRKLMYIPRVLTRESILFVLVIFNNKIMHELLTCTRNVSCRRDRFLYYRCTSFLIRTFINYNEIDKETNKLK